MARGRTNPRGRRSAALRAAALAWCGVSTGSACDFQYDIDPYTQYFGLNPDYSAYSPDDCLANCCADPSCDVWQYTDMPMGGVANCMHGVSYDYGDSGGIVWSGGEGRQDGPDAGGGGGTGGKKKKKCRGIHCDDGLDATIFLILFGTLAGAYLVSGTYYGMAVQNKSGMAALPNAGFWREVGGLVKDGMTFTLSGGTAKGVPPPQQYAPIPDAEAPIPGLVAAVQPGGVPNPQMAQQAVTFVESPGKGKKKVRVKREKSGKTKKVRAKKPASASSSGGGGGGGGGASSLE